MTELDEFEEWFTRDLEKWFSSDIACCGICHDQYIQEWPHAFDHNNGEFQHSGISLDYFYEGALLQERYSYDEFTALVRQLECPNCESNLCGYIWPYYLPVEITDVQKQNLKEVGELSINTPYLVLTHQFAKDVLLQIQEHHKSDTPKNVSKTFIRARCYEGKEFSLGDFSSPPAQYVKEGRYNHAGNSVLYLADSDKTCFKEMRSPSRGIYIVDVEINQDLKLLDLNEKLEMDGNILQTLIWSSLLSSKEESVGYYRPHYAFSRFVADCCKYVGFDGIVYPSVRDGESRNTVILEPEKFTEKILMSNIRKYQAL